MYDAVGGGGPRVGLFASCLVDLIRPSVGFATAKLLEDAGCLADVPSEQTCCGQPAFNSGDRKGAVAVAAHTVELFSEYEYTVLPSASCAGMLRHQYPVLFEKDARLALKAKQLASRTFELTEFLCRVRKVTHVEAAFQGKVLHHDSCSALRDLNVKNEPRQLLRMVRGLELEEIPDSEVCCGFGGTFCVKYPEISLDMVKRKGAAVVSTGADLLVSCDMGCLLNIAGHLRREGAQIKVRHVAEVLAGMVEHPAIGEGLVRDARSEKHPRPFLS